jgi:ABC-type amino acid transport substrate-binding protein
VVAGIAYSINKLLPSKTQSSVADSSSVPSSTSGEVLNAVKTQSKNNSIEEKSLQTNGTTYQSIIDKGVVRVSVQSPAKPFFYVEKGVPAGFNYDFLKILFAQSEFTLKHQKITLDTDNVVDTYSAVPEALLKLDNRGGHNVDIAIDGLTFSNDDLAGVVYSIPYIEDFGYALISPITANIKKIEDVNNLTIGILKGDPDVKAYTTRQWPKAIIVELDDASINGERSWIKNYIKAGKVDAIVYDYPFAVAEISGTDLQFSFTKLPNSDLKYKIGVQKNDAQLLENINIAIRKAKADINYVSLLKKYFTTKNASITTVAATGESIHIVKIGDTLSNISSTLLGNKMRYVEIESRNNLPNPNLIQVGQKLVIPKK